MAIYPYIYIYIYIYIYTDRVGFMVKNFENNLLIYLIRRVL